MTRFIQDLRDNIRGKFFDPFHVYGEIAEWLPTQLANLSLWLKGDTISRTLWNTPLYQQNDQSPEGNDGQLASGSGLNTVAANSDNIILPSVTLSGNWSVGGILTYTAGFGFILGYSSPNYIRITTASSFTVRLGSFTYTFSTLLATTGSNHWMVVRSSSNLTLYKNGIEVETKTGVDTGSYSFTLIGAFTGGAQYSDSIFQKMPIISTNLTASQVLEIYNNPQLRLPTGVDEVNLVRYYALDETSFLNGSIAFDSSCRKLTLTDATGYAIGQTVTVTVDSIDYSTKVLGMVGSVIAIHGSFTQFTAAASITNGTNVTTIASVVEPQHGTFSTTGTVGYDAAINGLTTGKQSLLSGFNIGQNWFSDTKNSLFSGISSTITNQGENQFKCDFGSSNNDGVSLGDLSGLPITGSSFFTLILEARQVALTSGTGGIQLRFDTDAGAADDTVNFTPTTQWVRYFLTVQADASASSISANTRIRNITANVGLSVEFRKMSWVSGQITDENYPYLQTSGGRSTVDKQIPGLHPTSITDLFGNAIQNHYISGLFNGVQKDHLGVIIGNSVDVLDAPDRSWFGVFKYNNEASTQFLLASRTTGDGFSIYIGGGKVKLINVISSVSTELIGNTSLTNGLWYSIILKLDSTGNAYLFVQELGEVISEDIPTANIGLPGDGSIVPRIGRRGTSTLPMLSYFNCLQINRLIDEENEGENLNTYYLILLTDFSDTLLANAVADGLEDGVLYLPFEPSNSTNYDILITRNWTITGATP